MIVIDATDLILGRLATFVAKKSLLGEEVRVINSEKAVISGKRAAVLSNLKTKYNRGTPSKGPFIPRMADRFVRRTIRGMLPYKLAKGSVALKRVLCYVGIPDEFKDTKAITLENANVKRLSTLNYITIDEAIKYGR